MFASKDTLLTRPSGGYNIARSVRLRSSASAYFNRTQGAGNRKIFTLSTWVKRGSLGSYNPLFTGQNDSSNSDWDTLEFNSTDVLRFYLNGTASGYFVTTQVFRDPSAWYHIVVAVDTTQATSTNRVKIYVNGSQITNFTTATYPSQNFDCWINKSGRVAALGANYYSAPTGYFDGYLTEINFIDGQALTPSSFGSTNAITGVWQPAKYTGTYGTNGFYLNFSDNSSNTATTIGKDYSGNGNNWTPNNISVTAGATYDSMTDVPTLTSATAANYCVLNPLATSNGTLNDGNLTWSPSGNNSTVWSSFAVNTGKWYFEMTKGTSGDAFISISQTPKFNGFQTDYDTVSVSLYMYYTSGGTSANRFQYNSTPTAFPSGFGNDDNGTVYGVTLDFDAKEITVYRNNDGTTKATFTMPAALYAAPLFVGYSVTSTWGSGQFYWNFGQRPFSYTPPTGFVALNTYNLPASTITNGAAYMAATLYTGDGASTKSFSNAVNGVSFQPDMVWSRIRAGTPQSIGVFDSIRGTTGQSLDTAATTVEGTWMGVNASDYGYVSAFDSGGFSVNDGAIATTGGYVNFSTRTYVGWQWKAGTTSASNTSGILTSQVSANTTAGFSVCTYTAPASSQANSFGHGLGVAPSMVIAKNRSSGTGGLGWAVYHSSLGANQVLSLNTTAASATVSGYWGSGMTSTVVGLPTCASSTGFDNCTGNMVAYCFAPVAGYSAFGSYTGNGSTDGTFIYTGFRPRWVMIKCTTDAGQVWLLLDTSRSPYNIAQETIYANESSAEATNPRLDFLSNGIKIRNTYGNQNTNGSTYIYAAFAENPMKYALAR